MSSIIKIYHIDIDLNNCYILYVTYDENIINLKIVNKNYIKFGTLTSTYLQKINKNKLFYYSKINEIVCALKDLAENNLCCYRIEITNNKDKIVCFSDILGKEIILFECEITELINNRKNMLSKNINKLSGDIIDIDNYNEHDYSEFDSDSYYIIFSDYVCDYHV